MVCAITLQRVPIQPRGTRVAGVAFGKSPSSHCAIITIEIERIKVFRGQHYNHKNYVCMCVCLHSSHFCLEPIPNLKSKSIAQALSKVELRFNVRILRIYADNHVALRGDSLGPAMREVKKLFVKEGDLEEEVSIFNNPSYTKQRSYAERKIRDVRQSLREINAVRMDLVFNSYKISHLLLIIKHKWNIVP